MPFRFTPMQGTDIKSILPQLNKNFASLDKEAVSKTFTKANSGETWTVGNTGDDTFGEKAVVGGITTVTFGKYRDGRYALIFYNPTTGVPEELLGQAPDDGRIGHWTAEPGQNVITLLGG